MIHRWAPTTVPRTEVCKRPGCTAVRRQRGERGYEYAPASGGAWDALCPPRCSGAAIKTPHKHRPVDRGDEF